MRRPRYIVRAFFFSTIDDVAVALPFPLGVMSKHVSISKAIWLGWLVVNGPVLLLSCGPFFVFDYLIKSGVISRSYNWAGFLIITLDFVLAWLWWSLSVPKWRLWAYQRVDDIATLKDRAVAVRLTWPDNHFFSRTEIKSRSHALRERQLDTSLREADISSDSGKQEFDG
jgi:hypothetical protein